MTDPVDHDTLPPSFDPKAGKAFIEPPRTVAGAFRHLGPGLIIAASIVGSGELIATTKTGAQAGMTLLWLIIVGCLIKVFVQVELGRYTISHGETTLAALDQVPGPRLRLNWIVWSWLVMMVLGFGQLGGIVGGVGQSLALTFPLKGDYAAAIEIPSTAEITRFLAWHDRLLGEWGLRKISHRVKSARSGEPDQAAPRRDAGSHEVDPAAWRESSLRTAALLFETVLLDRPILAARLMAHAGALEHLEDQLRREGNTSVAEIETSKEYALLLRELNETLVEVNLELLADDSLTDASNGGLAVPADESERLRLLRGQAILSHQLALLDQDQERGTLAASAVADWLQAKKELRQAEDAAAKTDATAAVRSAKEKVGARALRVGKLVDPPTYDDKIWAAVVSLVTSVLLFCGRYRLIQNISVFLVVVFTFVTVGNVVALQGPESLQWHISWAEFLNGLSFRLPDGAGQEGSLSTALATFGIIGVGASELIAYPYWCLEKGYAKHAGRRDDSAAWAQRARGWMRVMHFDTFTSMVIYTVATLAFYLMGAAVLFKEGRDPDGMRMVSTLATAYVPVFGLYAKWMFLVGAFAVLYSTFLVANAGNARMWTDVLKVAGLMDKHNETLHNRSVTVLSVVLPFVCLAVFATGINPVKAILLSGAMQALLLPMIGVGALYFRYTRTDKRLLPAPWWDVLLVLSCLGLLVAGLWGAVDNFSKVATDLKELIF